MTVTLNLTDRQAKDLYTVVLNMSDVSDPGEHKENMIEIRNKLMEQLADY